MINFDDRPLDFETTQLESHERQVFKRCEKRASRKIQDVNDLG